VTSEKKKEVTIAGIILAAGEGKRFGGNKALAKIDEISFLEKIANSLKEIGCNPIVVVIGSVTEPIIKEAKRLRIGYAINDNWKDGQFSSLQKGLKEIKNDVSGALITLVDHPLVKYETYNSLKDKFSQSSRNIFIPLYNLRRGHPIVVPSEAINEIIETKNNITLRDILKTHESMIETFPCEDSGILKDIDTKEEYERLLNK